MWRTLFISSVYFLISYVTLSTHTQPTAPVVIDDKWMCWPVWERTQCDADVVMLTRVEIIYFYLFGCLVSFGLNKGTGVIRADGDEHDGKIPNTISKNREILVFLFCCRCFRNLMAARERFCRFSVEIFTQVRAWESVHNFHRIECTHPRRAVWLFTFSNHKSTSREISKWNIKHVTCFVAFEI